MPTSLSSSNKPPSPTEQSHFWGSWLGKLLIKMGNAFKSVGRYVKSLFVKDKPLKESSNPHKPASLQNQTVSKNPLPFKEGEDFSANKKDELMAQKPDTPSLSSPSSKESVLPKPVALSSSGLDKPDTVDKEALFQQRQIEDLLNNQAETLKTLQTIDDQTETLSLVRAINVSCRVAKSTLKDSSASALWQPFPSRALNGWLETIANQTRNNEKNLELLKAVAKTVRDKMKTLEFPSGHALASYFEGLKIEPVGEVTLLPPSVFTDLKEPMAPLKTNPLSSSVKTPSDIETLFSPITQASEALIQYFNQELAKNALSQDNVAYKGILECIEEVKKAQNIVLQHESLLSADNNTELTRYLTALKETFVDFIPSNTPPTRQNFNPNARQDIGLAYWQILLNGLTRRLLALGLLKKLDNQRKEREIAISVPEADLRNRLSEDNFKLGTSTSSIVSLIEVLEKEVTPLKPKLT